MTDEPAGRTPDPLAAWRQLHAMYLRVPPEIEAHHRATADHPSACMAVPPEVGQFLAMLVRLTGAQRVLELGTFLGGSALWMATAMGEEGRLVTIDINRDWNRLAREGWQAAGVAGRIEARLAPALVELGRLQAEGCSGRFDLAFLDADKRNYPSYLEPLLDLLRPGGLLVADNVFWGGRAVRPPEGDHDALAIARFNNLLVRAPQLQVSLVPIGDGLVLARKAG